MPRLAEEDDYKIDEKDRVATLTEEGLERVDRMLGIPDGKTLYESEYSEMAPYLDNALRAQVLYKRDKDYIVQDGEVIIVDEFTGRLMYGRRFSEGLHQAIEAKEGVSVRRENMTLATVTFQNFFRMYRKLAGMTGTALTEKEEFQRIYDLEVVAIPTNVGVRRTDNPDLVYKTQRAKFKAVLEEIETAHKRGQPLLVGTSAIETSEYISALLKRKGIEHNVLNAKNHEREAVIIAQAGRPYAVTIATNMAGRGVDILLGGNAENLAREEMRKAGFELNSIAEADWNEAIDILRKGGDPTQTNQEPWVQILAEQWRRTRSDGDKVREVGGLYVVGSERHEARRIDNQLRGRGGRQGDPGQSRFYLSLEDDLMRRFGGTTLSSLMDRLGVEEDMPIEAGVVSRAIEQAQTRVEGYNFDLRKHVLEYDDVVNKQRNVIYEERRRILTEPTLRPIALGMVEKQIASMVQTFTQEKYSEDWDLESLHIAIIRIMPLPIEEGSTAWQGMTREALTKHLQDFAEHSYDVKEQRIGAEAMRHIERLVMLQVVDNRWVRHLTDLDILREGIGLQAVAQQDPLVAYKREAYDMFSDLLANIEEDVATRVLHAELVQEPVRRPTREVHTSGGSTAASGRPEPQRKAGPNLGRNDLCWCGSGKKYKDCHLKIDRGGQPAGEAPPQPAKAQSQPAKGVAGSDRLTGSNAKPPAGKAKKHRR